MIHLQRSNILSGRLQQIRDLCRFLLPMNRPLDTSTEISVEVLPFRIMSRGGQGLMKTSALIGNIEWIIDSEISVSVCDC